MSVALLAAATVSLGATSGALASRSDEERPRDDQRGAQHREAPRGDRADDQGTERGDRSEDRQTKRGDRSEGPAGRRGEGPASRHTSGPRCSIQSSRLLGVDDSKILAKLAERLDAMVADGKITRQKADRIMKKSAIALTLNTASYEAAIAPLLELFDMTKEQFRMARVDGLSPKEMADDEGISRDDLRAALREGREKARAAVAELWPDAKGERAGKKSGADDSRSERAHREHHA